MLPDPGLVIPQGVAQGQVIQIPLMRVVDVALRWMGWHHKESVLHGSSRVCFVFELSHQPRAGAQAVPPPLPLPGRRSRARALMTLSYSGCSAYRLLYVAAMEEPEETVWQTTCGYEKTGEDHVRREN